MKSGYWQVPMNASATRENSFLLAYRFVGVMPFGLSDAAAVFQELMPVALQGFNNFVLAYLDDILVQQLGVQFHFKCMYKFVRGQLEKS